MDVNNLINEHTTRRREQIAPKTEEGNRIATSSGRLSERAPPPPSLLSRLGQTTGDNQLIVVEGLHYANPISWQIRAGSRC